MPAQYYKDALRLGVKERRNCVTHGQYPYLSVLDNFVSLEKSSNGIDLGVQQVPAEFIVGTKSAMRTTAFARNFMPLLPEDTEFASKWMQLCQSHLEEGIRDPVQLYEYMNRYYVAEGNKRVSILKYFDTATVAAQVTRVLPERTGDPDVELYYEFAAFQKCSGINFIEFTKPGGYAELQSLMGKDPDTPWTEDERRRFATVYYQFRSAYEAHGGKRLSTTVGNAMLACMRVYGYQDLLSISETEMKQSMEKAWEEIILQQEERPIALSLVPEEKKRTGLLSMVLPSGTPRELKAAFINDKSPDTSGWTLAHELGRLYAQRVFPEQVVTTAYHNALAGDPEQVIEQAIADYNETKDDLEQIQYTDYIGLMLSSITTIINAITYVLIAFVAVSLVVSSIMIGVITLISVQERTKEIGILRAIGASKRNVSSMFNAETVIIGFTSGALGVLITWVLCIPINAILHHLTGIQTLSAFLPLPTALVLVLISTALTLFSGIIPSRSAAKKDPVVALRTE